MKVSVLVCSYVQVVSVQVCGVPRCLGYILFCNVHVYGVHIVIDMTMFDGVQMKQYKQWYDIQDDVHRDF